MSNKLEVTLSFKPIMDGLDRFVSGINARMEKVKAFNMRIENGAKATNQLLAQAATVLGVQQLRNYTAKAEEAERAQKQLTAAMRRQGAYSGEYLDKLNAQADALERVTNFESEQITAVQRQLISYRVGKKDIESMTESALDLAQALGTGPEQAAVLLGKTLRGEQEELGRYGIQIDGTKNRVVALREAVQRFAGGQARSGVAFPALRQAAVEIDQLQKSAGKAVAEGLGPFIAGFGEGLRSAVDWLGKAVSLVRGFLPASDSLRPLGELLGRGTIAALAFLGPLLAIRGLMVGLPAVINPARMAFVFLSGVDMLDAVRDVQAFSKSLGIIDTMKVANWGQRFAAFGAVVGAAFGGWQIGSFLNELEVGGMKISDWSARALNVFLGWADMVGAAFQKAWVMVKSNFFEKLTEARILLLEFVNFSAEKLNSVFKLKIDTDGFKAAIAQYKKELGTLDADKAAALAAIDARLGTSLGFRAAVDDDLAGKGRAGVAKPGAPDLANGTAGDSAKFKSATDLEKERALREELALKRAIYELETAILEAQQDGNQKLVESLTRERDELAALNDLGSEAYDIIQSRLDIGEEMEKKKRADAEKEQAFSRALGEIAIKRADIEADRYRTQEQKQQAIMPLLQEEARLLRERIALLERAKELATPSDQLQIQQQIDGLRGQQADNTRGQAEAEPQTLLQGWQQGTTELLDSFGSKARQVAAGIQSVWQSVANAMSGALVGVITRTQTLGQGLKSIALAFGQSMLQALSDMVAQYAVKKAAMFALDQLFAAKGLMLSLAMAAKSLVAWIPSAIAASISSWGIAAAIGAAAVVGLLAFKDGGLVSGPGSGTSDSIPARLSNGEFVVKQKATSRFGSSFLEGINNGVLDLDALPGNIAAGMAVPEYGNGSAAGGGGGQDMAGLVDALAKKIKITSINVADDRAATRIQRRSQAEGDIVSIVRANRAAIFRQGPA